MNPRTSTARRFAAKCWIRSFAVANWSASAFKNSGDLWEQVKKLPEAPKTPPPPPAPRAVVEVFRGDKHERQIFK